MQDKISFTQRHAETTESVVTHTLRANKIDGNTLLFNTLKNEAGDIILDTSSRTLAETTAVSQPVVGAGFGSVWVKDEFSRLIFTDDTDTDLPIDDGTLAGVLTESNDAGALTANNIGYVSLAATGIMVGTVGGGSATTTAANSMAIGSLSHVPTHASAVTIGSLSNSYIDKSVVVGYYSYATTEINATEPGAVVIGAVSAVAGDGISLGSQNSFGGKSDAATNQFIVIGNRHPASPVGATYDYGLISIGQLPSVVDQGVWGQRNINLGSGNVKVATYTSQFNVILGENNTFRETTGIIIGSDNYSHVFRNTIIGTGCGDTLGGDVIIIGSDTITTTAPYAIFIGSANNGTVLGDGAYGLCIGNGNDIIGRNSIVVGSASNNGWGGLTTLEGSVALGNSIDNIRAAEVAIPSLRWEDLQSQPTVNATPLSVWSLNFALASAPTAVRIDAKLTAYDTTNNYTWSKTFKRYHYRLVTGPTLTTTAHTFGSSIDTFKNANPDAIGLKETTTVNCNGSEPPANVGGEYFTLNSAFDHRSYYVWLDANGDGVTQDPAPGGGLVGLAADISAASSDTLVATAIMNAVNSVDDFTATRLLEVVTITNAEAGTSTNVANVDVAGAAMVTTQEGTDSFDSYFTITGNVLHLYVKGLAATNVTWRGMVTVFGFPDTA